MKNTKKEIPIDWNCGNEYAFITEFTGINYKKSFQKLCKAQGVEVITEKDMKNIKQINSGGSWIFFSFKQISDNKHLGFRMFMPNIKKALQPKKYKDFLEREMFVQNFWNKGWYGHPEKHYFYDYYNVEKIKEEHRNDETVYGLVNKRSTDLMYFYVDNDGEQVYMTYEEFKNSKMELCKKRFN